MLKVQVSEFLKLMFEERKGLQTMMYTRFSDYLYHRNPACLTASNARKVLLKKFSDTTLCALTLCSLHPQLVYFSVKSILSLKALGGLGSGCLRH